MASDTVAWYMGTALGVAMAYSFIKWVRLSHVFFAVLYVIGTLIFALGGMFMAWPVTQNIRIPMLVGMLLWNGLLLKLLKSLRHL